MSEKKILIFLVLFFSFIGNSFSIEPDVFVQSTVNRASKVLGDNLSKDQKIDKLKSIAEETVDVNGIGMYTLGSYRKSLNNDQREEYKLLFKQYFLKTFSSRLAEYSNPEIQVNSKEKLNENYLLRGHNTSQVVILLEDIFLKGYYLSQFKYKNTR